MGYLPIKHTKKTTSIYPLLNGTNGKFGKTATVAATPLILQGKDLDMTMFAFVLNVTGRGTRQDGKYFFLAGKNN